MRPIKHIALLNVNPGPKSLPQNLARRTRDGSRVNLSVQAARLSRHASYYRRDCAVALITIG